MPMLESTNVVVITRVAVYRCSYCPPDRACALYPDDGFSAWPQDDRPAGAFGYDASRDECNHTWPRQVAEEVARRWNGEPGKVVRWELGIGTIGVGR